MQDTIIETIVEAVTSNNAFSYWEIPLIGFVSAARPEFNDLKKIVSENHLVPRDILPGAKSVICYFIPFHSSVVESNRDGDKASMEWARAYIATNELIAHIGDVIESLMGKDGFQVGKIPATHNFDKAALISNWSHRHVAYIAGLGTFGINNMFITDRGCCGRLGSIVTDYEFEYPAFVDREERCLFKRDGSCGICQNRCEKEVYKNGTFNRASCYETCLENADYYRDIGLADVCGKCCVGLPCSMTDPTKKKRSQSV
ncbi:MAG TPA: hypothetical protein PLA74_04830 [Syntrophales bacterium]|nr:hypothetical protein [Syntrophales bacterium]HPQ43979.1 hypothetical protein [Syntrophales bacterium]